MTRKPNTGDLTDRERAALEARPVLTWNDLTAAQKKRLVAISQGNQSHNAVVYELEQMGLVEIDGEYDYLFITPRGGELLRQREAIMIHALEVCADQYLIARQALAQVQIQEAHDGD